jgi:IclR family transcriptional regulator, acetate operon repressor
MATGDFKTAATVRSLAILAMASSSQDSISAADVAPKLGLRIATVKRLIEVLECTGHLQRVPGSKRYVAGNILNDLAIQTLINSPRRNVRRTALEDLAGDIGQTCNISCLAGDSIVLIDRVEGRKPLRKTFGPGARAPLHCTASGKLFLSMMPSQWRRQLLAITPLQSFTERTVTDVREIEKSLNSIRTRKISLDDREFQHELVGIAVPVFDSSGRFCATVSANSETDRNDASEILRLVPALNRASRAIAQTFNA